MTSDPTPTDGIPPEARAWAEAQLAERGPMPQAIHDLVAPLLRRDTRKTA